jgi:hypothetical protein
MTLNLHQFRAQIEHLILGYSTGPNPITRDQAVGAAAEIVSMLERSLAPKPERLKEAIKMNELSQDDWAFHRDHEKREMSFRSGVEFALTGVLPEAVRKEDDDEEPVTPP